MINNTVEINTLKEFEAYCAPMDSEGYTASIEDICGLLGVKLSKAEKLLKIVPRVEIKESLYHRLKNKKAKAYRAYYNELQVVEYLIKSDLLHASYGDARAVFSEARALAVDEIPVDKEYLLNNLFNTFMILQWSKTLNDIIIEDMGYTLFEFVGGSNKDLIYISEHDEIKTATEIYSKSDVVKYTRMIQRDFYVKFLVAEKDESGKLKRGNIQYFQSMRTAKIKGLSKIIEDWVKDYEANRKE